MRIEEEKDVEVNKVTNQLNEFKLQIDSLNKQQSEFFKRFQASTQPQPYQSNCFSSQGRMLNQQPPQGRATGSSNYRHPIVCYNCGKQGHMARDFQLPSASSNSLNFSGRRN